MDPCYSSWADSLERWWVADRPARVLDVCCGTGLMTAELAGRGLDVVGVDASPAMLAIARDRLGATVDLVECVLPDLPVDGPFDAAVSTLDGLNYLDPDDLRATFAAISAVLRHGGWFVFDVHTDATLAFLLDRPVIEGQQDGATFTLTTAVSGRTCSTRIDFASPDTDSSFAETHTQHIHSADDIRSDLTDAGFVDIVVLDEYTDARASEATLRATWVARHGGPLIT